MEHFINDPERIEREWLRHLESIAEPPQAIVYPEPPLTEE